MGFREGHLRLLQERDPAYYEKHLRMAQLIQIPSVSRRSNG